jgi:hypothetical protein
MKKTNVLSSSSFIILNEALIKELGLNEALILGFLIDRWEEVSYGDFYYTIDDLSKDTTLSDRICRKCLQTLVNQNILIKTNFTGLPPKQYYNINCRTIIEKMGINIEKMGIKVK